jgi:hypothetical protein
MPATTTGDGTHPIPACVANNENHNSRVAMFVAQEYPCGAGVESKISTSTGVNEDYLALRAGNHLESAGTVRASRAQ